MYGRTGAWIGRRCEEGSFGECYGVASGGGGGGGRKKKPPDKKWEKKIIFVICLF